MKKNSWFLFLFVFSIPLFGQPAQSNFDELRKNAISLNIFGPTPVIGITYERVLSKHFTAEIGIGFPSIGAGAKFYPTELKTNKVKFFMGATITYLNTVYLLGAEREWEGSVIYTPLGISFFGKEGFNFGMDGGIGIAIPTHNDRDGGGFLGFGNLRLGYRF